MPEIKLDNIVKNYGTDTNSLDNLDLTVEDGDFMCLLGPSGCGKTTTVRMIAGLEHATSGRIQIGDSLVDSPDDRKFVSAENRNIGLVFQSYALWPHLTVRENIAYGLKIKKTPKNERSEKIATTAMKLGITDYLDRYPAQLSGGQQQRVALARMLVVNPKLMLLDEPLSNLDSRLRLEMRAELKRIHRDFGATIVFVTHDQWEAMTLATRVAVLHDGCLQQVGSPTEIYDRPVNKFVANFLGSPPINFIEEGESEISGSAMSELRRLVPAHAGTVKSIGIRPESILLRENTTLTDSNELVLKVRVNALLPTGGNWTIELAHGADRLYATVLDPGGLGPDQELLASVPQSKLHLFGADEQRIEASS